MPIPRFEFRLKRVIGAVPVEGAIYSGAPLRIRPPRLNRTRSGKRVVDAGLGLQMGGLTAHIGHVDGGGLSDLALDREIPFLDESGLEIDRSAVDIGSSA